MFYHSFSIGFIEIPNINASLNIYTVGCPFKCKGCHNKDLQNINHPQRKILDIEEIIKTINNSNNFIQGICWLGGEPLYQFKDFISINHKIKSFFPNISICLYTGYTLQNIINNNPDEYNDLLTLEINYIIDGPWKGISISDKNSNQKIYKFNYSTNNYSQISYEEFKNGK